MSPSEVVDAGDDVQVKILEVDEERRRISLSMKRVEGGGLPLRDSKLVATAEPDTSETAASAPQIDLSEEVFAEPPPPTEGAEGEEGGEDAGGAEEPGEAAGEENGDSNS